jgi:hypothetical protein
LPHKVSQLKQCLDESIMRGVNAYAVAFEPLRVVLVNANA